MDISIVVPTHKRHNLLKQCLDSISKQDYPKEKYEVIVVMDGECDITREMLEKIKDEFQNLKYVVQKQKGPAAARNSGAEASSGKIIAFVDDDCTVERDWIRLMMETFRVNPDTAAVGGHTLTSTLRTPVLVSQFLSTCSIQTNVNGKEEVVFFPTCNVSVKKDTFNEYKFNEDFPLPGGEDLEFFWRLFKNGHRFVWNKNIKVIHYRDDNFHNFIKQAYIYGRGNLLAQHIHKDQPLLKELKTGRFSFWAATLINILKIPRFSYLLGRRLIEEHNISNIHGRLSVFAYFAIHKVLYLAGNVIEFLRIRDLNWHKALYTAPRLLILDITHSCNLSCRICDIWKTGNTEKDIGIPYVKNMLLQARELNINEIALSGGEPLLRKDIFEIFEYAKGIKIRNLGLLTNGILVEEYFDKLKPYLLDNTISLVISFDSLISHTHNYVRNSDNAWQKTLECLRLSSMLKKEYPQVNFNIITIILDRNLEELPDIAYFIKSLGANSLQFQVLLPNNLKMAERKKSIFWVSEERLPVLDGAIDKLIDFKKENKEFIKNSIENLSLAKKYYRAQLNSGDVKCVSARDTILTSNQGTYATCFSSYGSISRQTLKDILTGKEIIEARERVRNCSWPCLLPCFCDAKNS